jgi:hypothetical protein
MEGQKHEAPGIVAGGFVINVQYLLLYWRVIAASRSGRIAGLTGCIGWCGPWAASAFVTASLVSSFAHWVDLFVSWSGSLHNPTPGT